jgi:hypothetical protein
LGEPEEISSGTGFAREIARRRLGYVGTRTVTTGRKRLGLFDGWQTTITRDLVVIEHRVDISAQHRSEQRVGRGSKEDGSYSSG